MTLHWWMHWFWVTTLLLLVIDKGGALPLDVPASTTTSPVPRGPKAMYVQTSTTPTPVPRRPKAMYVQPPSPPSPPSPTLSKLHIEALADIKSPPLPAKAEATSALVDKAENVTKVTEETQTEHKDNLTHEDLAAESTPHEEATEHEWLETTLAELVAPASSGDLLQASIPAGRTEDKEDRMQAGAIAGITLSVVAVMALSSVAAFVLYRRRYLNTPQTLNDKCSNPDSSGYLDDSTVRENSEEMYSLDNDSFLNSLEAMTIQNYWTESVKHSKL